MKAELNIIIGHICTFTFEKSGQHPKQYSQQEDDDNKHGEDKKPATGLWERQRRRVVGAALLPPSGPPRYCGQLLLIHLLRSG